CTRCAPHRSDRCPPGCHGSRSANEPWSRSRPASSPGHVRPAQAIPVFLAPTTTVRGRDFFRPAGSAGRTDDRGVDTPEVPTQPTAFVEVIQQVGEDPHPGAVQSPTPEAIVDGLPRPHSGTGYHARGHRSADATESH